MIGVLLLPLMGAACHTPPSGAGGARVITSNVQDWRDEVIYQVVVDRFADGDYSNNVNVEESHLGRYQGGDWRGVIQRIPYLKALGITALWISPVVKNLEQDAGLAGYHGYWTQDFQRVNPHFGDLAQLQEMVDALHAEGIKVILDVVLNHIGPLFYYDVNLNGQADEMLFAGGGASPGSNNADVPAPLTRFSEWDPDYDSRGVQAFSAMGEGGLAPVVWTYQPAINRVPVLPEPFQNPDWYHRKGRVTVWTHRPALGQPPCLTAPDDNIELCQYIRMQELLGDFPGGLKDLATELPEVRQALIEIFKRWIELGDFDGFRLDTLKHLDHGFIKEFSAAIRQHAKELGKENFLLFGEAFSGADRLLGEYTAVGEMDSVLYFSQKFKIIDEVFKRGGATAALEQLHLDRAALYEGSPQPDGVGVAPNQLLINFLDNHDVPRFLNDGTLPGLHCALVYLLTTVGIPCLYYGTEQLLSGGTDPGNRERLWSGNPSRGLAPYDTQNETFQLTAALIKLRRQYPSLRRGDLRLVWTTESVQEERDAGILAFERQHEGEVVLVVINTRECTADKPFSWTSDGEKSLKSSFAAGSVLVDALSPDSGGDPLTVGPDGSLDIKVPCQDALILVLQH